MVAISLMVLEKDGPDWPRWKRLVAEVETLGFAGLYRGDHFTSAWTSFEESLDWIISRGSFHERLDLF